MFDVYMIVTNLIKPLSEARHNLYSTKKNVDAANRHWMEINYNCLHILVIHRICSKKETIKCYASESIKKSNWDDNIDIEINKCY